MSNFISLVIGAALGIYFAQTYELPNLEGKIREILEKLKKK